MYCEFCWRNLQRSLIKLSVCLLCTLYTPDKQHIKIRNKIITLFHCHVLSMIGFGLN